MLDVIQLAVLFFQMMDRFGLKLPATDKQIARSQEAASCQV